MTDELVEAPREAGVASDPMPVGSTVPPVAEPAVVELVAEPATVAPPEAVVVHLSPIQHIEAWWAELKASAPAPMQKAFWVHAEEEWHKLVARLEGK